MGAGPRKLRWIVLIAMIICPSAALAGPVMGSSGSNSGPGREHDNQPARQISGKLPSSLPSMNLLALWPLAAVFGAIFVLAALLKRWSPARKVPGGRGGLEILSRQFLSNKQSLCVVRFGRRVLCVGVTPETITTLVRVDDPDEASEIIVSAAKSSPSSFTSLLSKFAAKPADLDIQTETPAAESKPVVIGRDVRSLLARVRVMADAQAA